MKTEAEFLREKCIELEARELGFIQSLREMEAENAQSRDHIIEQERGICGRDRRIAELEAERDAEQAWRIREQDQVAELLEAVQAVLDEADYGDEWVAKWKIEAAIGEDADAILGDDDG